MALSGVASRTHSAFTETTGVQLHCDWYHPHWIGQSGGRDPQCHGKDQDDDEKKKQTRTRPWPKRIHYLHETAFESDDSINSIFHEIARVDCQLGRDTEAEWWRFACVYVGVFFHSLFFSILWQFCLSWIQSLGWHEPLGTATDLTTCLPQHVQRTASSVPFSLGLSFFFVCRVSCCETRSETQRKPGSKSVIVSTANNSWNGDALERQREREQDAPSLNWAARPKMGETRAP